MRAGCDRATVHLVKNSRELNPNSKIAALQATDGVRPIGSATKKPGSYSSVQPPDAAWAIQSDINVRRKSNDEILPSSVVFCLGT